MDSLIPTLRAIFYAFAALALIAGGLLFIGAENTEDTFSWTIAPPLSAATLGAFYWAAFVLLLSAARARSWAEASPAVYPVTAIAVLLLATTLIHLDRFDLDGPFGIFWLVAYCLVAPLIAAAVAMQPRTCSPPAGAGLPAALRAALVAEGALLIAAGALLWVAPDAGADLWPWELTPLTGRAIGSFLLGIGLAALNALRVDDPVRFRGAAHSYAALGALELLALAIWSRDLGGDEVATAVYVGFWVAVLASGLYGSSAARAASRS